MEGNDWMTATAKPRVRDAAALEARRAKIPREARACYFINWQTNALIQFDLTSTPDAARVMWVVTEWLRQMHTGAARAIMTRRFHALAETAGLADCIYSADLEMHMCQALDFGVWRVMRGRLAHFTDAHQVFMY